MLGLLVSAAALAAASVCGDSGSNLEKVRTRMVQEILPYTELRSALLSELQDGRGVSCRQALASYMKETLAAGEKGVGAKGRLSLVLLAASAKIPEVTPVLQYEIDHGRGADLLESLGQVDRKVYAQTLANWTSDTAAQIRSAQNLSKGSAELYGMNSLGVQDENHDPLRLLSPLIFERYLREIKESKLELSREQLGDLNVIYAASTSAYREAFRKALTDVLGQRAPTWISSFRVEPVWVQARLFPLLIDVGGPEVVRELMWLSSYHSDLRVRGLANHALDKIIAKPVH